METTFAYKSVVRVKALLKVLKKTFFDPCPGFRISAQSAGLNVRAFMALKNMVIAMVSEN
jgi:hypothetical protein